MQRGGVLCIRCAAFSSRSRPFVRAPALLELGRPLSTASPAPQHSSVAAETAPAPDARHASINVLPRPLTTPSRLKPRLMKPPEKLAPSPPPSEAPAFTVARAPPGLKPRPPFSDRRSAADKDSTKPAISLIETRGDVGTSKSPEASAGKSASLESRSDLLKPRSLLASLTDKRGSLTPSSLLKERRPEPTISKPSAGKFFKPRSESPAKSSSVSDKRTEAGPAKPSPPLTEKRIFERAAKVLAEKQEDERPPSDDTRSSALPKRRRLSRATKPSHRTATVAGPAPPRTADNAAILKNFAMPAPKRPSPASTPSAAPLIGVPDLPPKPLSASSPSAISASTSPSQPGSWHAAPAASTPSLDVVLAPHRTFLATKSPIVRWRAAPAPKQAPQAPVYASGDSKIDEYLRKEIYTEAVKYAIRLHQTNGTWRTEQVLAIFNALKDSLHILPALRWLEVIADTGGEMLLEPLVALLRIGAKKPMPELANRAYKLASQAKFKLDKETLSLILPLQLKNNDLASLHDVLRYAEKDLPPMTPELANALLSALISSPSAPSVEPGVARWLNRTTAKATGSTLALPCMNALRHGRKPELEHFLRFVLQNQLMIRYEWAMLLRAFGIYVRKDDSSQRKLSALVYDAIKARNTSEAESILKELIHMPEPLPGDWSKLCQVFASSLLDNDHVGKAKEWETKAAELQQDAVLKIISAAERLLAEDSNSPAQMVTPIKRSFTRRVIARAGQSQANPLRGAPP